MPDYATKSDLSAIRDDLRGEMHAIRDDLRGEMHTIRDDLRGEMHAIRDELREDLGGQIRGVGAMVERMQSDVRVIAEALGGFARKSDLEAIDQRLTARVALLEDAIRELARSQRMSTDEIRLVRADVAQVRLQLDRRELHVDELERRVAEVERRLGIQSKG